MISSSSDSQKTRAKIELQHFLHDHPLIFFEDVEELQCCGICDEAIIDEPMYGCDRCSFYAHKLCAESPKQVRNMLHPAHLLELSRSNAFRCNACGEYFSSYSYGCSLCKFDLHIKCSLKHSFEEPQGHEMHEFEILKPALFTCDGCGTEEVNKCLSCICKTCQLQVHSTCTNTYSFTIKEPRHTHLLKLTYSFQSDSAFTDKICKICFYKMNDVLCMYCCADCDFFTHVKCGVSTNTLLHDDGHVLEIEDKVSSSNTLEIKETLQQQVEHFSHSHLLTININGPNSIILCNGCVKPISESFYSCEQCNFFLHRHCFELKDKIQHPLHGHELTLVSAWDILTYFSETCFKFIIDYKGNGIKCYGCGFDCNGFMYTCEKCMFYLDVGCSLLPDVLRHEGHTCALTLIDMRKRCNHHWIQLTRYETKCSACGLECLNNFVCEGCNFNLDLQCASLPKWIPHQCPKHDWNLHPFELMFKPIEDGRCGKHYCDVCEEERSENHWFYYCQDCDYSSHPCCILGEDRVKYGSLLKFKIHPHMICFSKATENRTCKKCSRPCKKGQPVFTCKECDVQFHYVCTLVAEHICISL